MAAAASLGLVAAVAPGTSCAADQTDRSLDRIEVTGSRLKRPETEGAMPVTVIRREDIEKSGAATLSDLLRNATLNSFGSPRPTPLSTQQSFAGMSIHGLGTKRTLILVDGHRLPTAPTVGSSQNLNNVPLSMVERVEILSDGASAIYGADAIGGVINIITRHGFSGGDVSISGSSPSQPGADRASLSANVGINGEHGQFSMGASRFRRTRVWARDRSWEPVGASSFSNTLLNAIAESLSPNGYRPGGRLQNAANGSALPGNGCLGEGFYTVGSGATTACYYDFNRVAAAEPDQDDTSIYGNGTLHLNQDWSLRMSGVASQTRIQSTNASTPSSPWLGDAIFLPVGSPNHPATRFPNAGYAANMPVFLRHRFAGIGNRESDTKDRVLGLTLSAEGRAGDFDLRFGTNVSDSRVRMTGRNYVLRDVADTFIRDGRYDIYDPTHNRADILAAMRTDIHRDSNTRAWNLFGDARIDIATMQHGVAQLAFGVDARRESYSDIYDPIVSANRVAGLSDSSASGHRNTEALYAEMLLPILQNTELTLAGRYDHYSQFGGAFSPKVALRYHPRDNLTLRASFGTGFAAPTLRNLNRHPSFFLSTVNHPETCASLGLGTSCLAEIETYQVGNTHLEPETSRQLSVGLSWQPWHWLDLTADVFRVTVKNQEAYVDALAIANCLDNIAKRNVCPRNLSVLPASVNGSHPGNGLGVAFGPNHEILYAQVGYANLGTIAATGFDLGVDTHFDLGAAGTLRNHLSFDAIGSFDSNGTQSAGAPGNPDGRIRLSNEWQRKSLVATWTVNIIGGATSNAGMRARAGQSDLGYAHRIPTHITHDVQIDWNTPWSGRVSVGIENVTNRSPYIDPLDATYNTALYDGYGRVPYLRYTQTF